MSMSIQRSKYTGDPGLFDFFKGVAKTGLGIAGMLPGVGGVARTASRFMFPPAPGTTTYAQMPTMSVMPQFPTAGPGGISGLGSKSVAMMRDECKRQGITEWFKCGNERHSGRGYPGYIEYGFGQQQVPAPGIIAATQRFFPGGETGMMDPAMQAGKPCPVAGYHWNKSGYFLLTGEYVSPGTKMVKNRRRNPANPRATSNAISRIKGAKRYAKSLSSISIRKKC